MLLTHQIPELMYINETDHTLKWNLVQGAEVWGCHGDWIKSAKPSFGPGIKERFEMASKITPDDVAKAAVSQEK